MPITHAFVSGKADGADPSLLQPSHWDADHVGEAGASDVVQVHSGHGSIVIPGLAGSPDIVPGSPSAYDNEFDAALSGWTTLGSLDTNEANVIPSHLNIRKSTSGDRYDGIYKAAPSTPFTMTAKLTEYRHAELYAGAGLMVLDATPSNLFAFGPHANAAMYYADMVKMQATVGGGRGTFSDAEGFSIPKYIRMIVTHHDDVTCQQSENGYLWHTVHANAATNLADVTYFGFYLWTYIAVPAEAVIDWIRFT
jgi:hypothetical protein